MYFTIEDLRRGLTPEQREELRQRFNVPMLINALADLSLVDKNPVIKVDNLMIMS